MDLLRGAAYLLYDVEQALTHAAKRPGQIPELILGVARGNGAGQVALAHHRRRRGELAHPAPDRGDLDVTLRRLGVADELVVMSAQTETNEAAMRKLAQSGWALDDIDAGYASFVKRFRPLIAAYGKNTEVSARTAFLVRTLLIQEYRKVLLRDPQLPAELLPSDWHGTAAYQLCRNLYRALFEAADDYLSAVMETADGPLPPPNKRYFQRFGGLRTA